MKVTDIEFNSCDKKNCVNPPHFITVYCDNKLGMMKLGTDLWHLFRRVDPELWGIQREDLRHLPGDVPHFHPHACTEACPDPSVCMKGEPNLYREDYFHFHVLYKEPVTMSDVYTLIQRIEKLGIEVELQ